MSLISQAAQILRHGGLVAFATETVYGLGADATNAQAVQEIFAAKGRPSTNPIIVHVADEESARRYAAVWPPAAEKLASQFWPGPLTLIVPRGATLAPEVSAGGTTVGLRAPNHPIALELLRAFDGPIAAPSANRSTRISPTTAQHVREELGDRVNMILDGGPCQVGIESTVLDISRPAPAILRQGAITQAQIEEIIGPVTVFSGSISPNASAISPGLHAIHYAPQAPAYRFERDQADRAQRQMAGLAPRSVALLAMNAGAADTFVVNVIIMPIDPATYAQQLYAQLREADRPGVEAIFVEMPPATPAWAAIRDRLTRATKPL